MSNFSYFCKLLKLVDNFANFSFHDELLRFYNNYQLFAKLNLETNNYENLLKHLKKILNICFFEDKTNQKTKRSCYFIFKSVSTEITLKR